MQLLKNIIDDKTWYKLGFNITLNSIFKLKNN
jgi:hypothetical protein